MVELCLRLGAPRARMAKKTHSAYVEVLYRGVMVILLSLAYAQDVLMCAHIVKARHLCRYPRVR
jgi:hypothetical protein